MADDVQPADSGEGQGDASTDSGLYDLDSVAPDVRELLEPHIKAINGNVEKKFREAADYRKQWQPYEESGIKDVPPETLQELLQFAQMANDPSQAEQFNQWLQATAEARGLGLGAQGEDDLGLDDVDEMSTDKIQELIAEQVAEKVNPIQERFQRQDQERLEQEANQEISTQLESIRKDNPDLPEGAENAIVRLAYSYADEDKDPIGKGFEEYKELIGAGEKGLFARKDGQPQTPEGPGAAATAPDKLSNDWNDPARRAIALERLKKANA
jgi:hypothetical protein